MTTSLVVPFIAPMDQCQSETSVNFRKRKYLHRHSAAELSPDTSEIAPVIPLTLFHGLKTTFRADALAKRALLQVPLTGVEHSNVVGHVVSVYSLNIVH